MSDPKFVAGLRPIPSSAPGAADPVAADIDGTDPSGRPVAIRMNEITSPVLLAFLHVRCDGCDEIWRGIRDEAQADPGPSTSVVVVTRGPGSVDPREVERVATGTTGVPVVMSDQAWIDYRVTGYPFLVLVDPRHRSVVAESVGFGWSDVVSMLGSVS